MKNVLSVNQSNINNKFFIMNNNNNNLGQVKGTPYFDTMKEASIAMFKLTDRNNTNIYDMNQSEYEKYTL